MRRRRNSVTYGHHSGVVGTILGGHGRLSAGTFVLGGIGVIIFAWFCDHHGAVLYHFLLMQILVMLGFDISHDARQDTEIRIAVGYWRPPLLLG